MKLVVVVDDDEIGSVKYEVLRKLVLPPLEFLVSIRKELSFLPLIASSFFTFPKCFMVLYQRTTNSVLGLTVNRTLAKVAHPHVCLQTIASRRISSYLQDHKLHAYSQQMLGFTGTSFCGPSCGQDPEEDRHSSSPRYFHSTSTSSVTIASDNQTKAQVLLSGMLLRLEWHR